MFFQSLITSYVPLGIDTLHCKNTCLPINQIIYIVLQLESVLLCIRRGIAEYEAYTASG